METNTTPEVCLHDQAIAIAIANAISGKFCKRRMSAYHDPDDFKQEAVVSALCALSSYLPNQRESLRDYIVRSVRRDMIQLYRLNTRHAGRDPDAEAKARKEAVRMEGGLVCRDDPTQALFAFADDLYGKGIDEARFNALAKHLTFLQAVALDMYYLGGATQEEIAYALGGIKRQVVAKHICAGLRKLKKLLRR